MIDQEAVERAKALLARTEARGATPQEAALARAYASRLLLRLLLGKRKKPPTKR